MKLPCSKTVVAAALAAVSIGVSAAPPASSTFDTNIDGWTANTPDTSWASTDGNPGGYLRFVDNTAGLALVEAPSKFLGDWSALNGVGSITYDHKIFDTGSIINFGPYGARVFGPGGAASWNGATPTGPTGWVTQTVALNAANWTVTSGTWNGLLSNVTDFQIVIELVGNPTLPGDITGLDNVAVVIPEPETYAMLALGLGVLAVARLRRRDRGVRLG